MNKNIIIGIIIVVVVGVAAFYYFYGAEPSTAPADTGEAVSAGDYAPTDADAAVDANLDAAEADTDQLLDEAAQ